MHGSEYPMGKPWYVWFGIGCLFNQIVTRILNADKFKSNGAESSPDKRMETWTYNIIIVGVYALSVYKQPELWWVGLSVYAGTTIISIIYRNFYATKAVDSIIAYFGMYIKPVAFFCALLTLALIEKGLK